MTAGAARVVADGWGWRYAGRRLPAVSDVSFVIEPGERVLLLGASGAGKSTLMTGIAGLLGDAEEGERSGSLLVDGLDPERQRGRIGLVLQDPDVRNLLSEEELRQLFDYQYHTRHIDYIFTRVGLD